MAVVGSGPAGFYTASRVIQNAPSLKGKPSVHVDMFELLPAPFGLVRYGVAPDHPEVKNVEHKFTEMMDSDKFRFFGNVRIGDGGIPLDSLREHYDAVVLSYGAGHDRVLGIPGEDLHGVYSARSFVGWYNGHPDFLDLNPRLDGDTAVVIGQGNVALDVARILLTDVDVLRKTDITEYALEALSRSKIRKVHVVGRRGPLNVAFTSKELREMMTLPGVGFEPVDPTTLQSPELKDKRPLRRLMDLIAKGSKTPMSDTRKSWQLDFLRSPAEICASPANASHVGSIRYDINELKDNKAVKIGRTATQNTDLVFRSVGYKAEPITTSGLPFDQQKAIIPNDSGRIAQGIYTSGWVKRGPTGVIASTMYDAFETADRILYDYEERDTNSTIKPDILPLLKDIHYVTSSDWKEIDRVERERGSALGKEREKIASVRGMLALVGK